MPQLKILSDMFPIKNGLKEGDALLSQLFNFALEYGVRKVKANHKLLILKCTNRSQFMLMMLIYRAKAYTP